MFSYSGYKIFSKIIYICGLSNKTMKKKLLYKLLILGILYAFNNHSQTFTWVNKYGVSSNSMLSPEASVTDAAGNVYITGRFTAGTVVLPGYTLTTTFSEEIFVMKTHPGGTVLWAAKPNSSRRSA